MYHLSDALLATTGLPSRGRRKRVIRLLYLDWRRFLLSVAFSDSLIQVVAAQRIGEHSGWPRSSSSTCFTSCLPTDFAFFNVQRARKRCLTPASARRMAYLQIAFLDARAWDISLFGSAQARR